jgi:hypothetical protein
VDPSIICGPGRTQEEYDVEGTGNIILFQVDFFLSLIFWEKAPLSYQQKEMERVSNYQSFKTSI